MSTKQLTEKAMALPLPERVTLAQSLWQSIGGGNTGRGADMEHDALEQADQRDLEIASGRVKGRTHEQVMKAARKSIGCA